MGVVHASIESKMTIIIFNAIKFTFFAQKIFDPCTRHEHGMGRAPKYNVHWHEIVFNILLEPSVSTTVTKWYIFELWHNGSCVYSTLSLFFGVFVAKKCFFGPKVRINESQNTKKGLNEQHRVQCLFLQFLLLFPMCVLLHACERGVHFYGEESVHKPTNTYI